MSVSSLKTSATQLFVTLTYHERVVTEPERHPATCITLHLKLHVVIPALTRRPRHCHVTVISGTVARHSKTTLCIAARVKVDAEIDVCRVILKANRENQASLLSAEKNPTATQLDMIH